MHGIAMLPMRPSQEDSALALERFKGSKRYSMRRERVWKNSGILNQQRHHRWLRSDEPGCWEVHQTVHRPQRQGKEEGYHCDFPMPGLRMVPDVQWKDSCRCLSWQTFQGKLPHSSGRSESKRGRLTFSLFRNAHSAIPELAFSFSGIYTIRNMNEQGMWFRSVSHNVVANSYTPQRYWTLCYVFHELYNVIHKPDNVIRVL